MRIIIPAFRYFSCSQFMTLGPLFVKSTEGTDIKGDRMVTVGRALFPPWSQCPGPGGGGGGRVPGSQGTLRAPDCLLPPPFTL